VPGAGKPECKAVPGFHRSSEAYRLAGPGVSRVFYFVKGGTLTRKTTQDKGKTGFLGTKEAVARLSIASISVLIIMKAVASFITGSIGIQADAIHSLIDLSGAVIGYIGIRIAAKPPDREHAFGHGKTEDVAGLVIACIIFLAAAIITYEAIQRLITGGAVEMVALGIYVTAAAIVINLLISWHAMRVARVTESIALEATARDMQADVMSSVAVLIGLVAVRFTGLTVLDPIVALLVAALIARAAYVTLKKSLTGLMDTRLSEEEEQAIHSVIMEHSGEVVGFHALRTRKAGNRRYIDLHLVVPHDKSINSAHVLCERLEEDIKNVLPGADLTVHVEPCTTECDECELACKPEDKDLSRAKGNINLNNKA
jgi:cation diffusion facilitator family transporter